MAEEDDRRTGFFGFAQFPALLVVKKGKNLAADPLGFHERPVSDERGLSLYRALDPFARDRGKIRNLVRFKPSRGIDDGPAQRMLRTSFKGHSKPERIGLCYPDSDRTIHHGFPLGNRACLVEYGKID
jgi:hypothetical protein